AAECSPHSTDIACIVLAVNNALYGCGLAPPTATPTPSPAATATLAAGQCRRSDDCTPEPFCLEPGGFLGCGTCYPDSLIDQYYDRCSTDADCHVLGDSKVCNQLGLASRTCDPCTGDVSVCMQGCSSGDEECSVGQTCELHRCLGTRCSTDQQCPPL